MEFMEVALLRVFPKPLFSKILSLMGVLALVLGIANTVLAQVLPSNSQSDIEATLADILKRLDQIEVNQRSGTQIWDRRLNSTNG